MELKKEMGEEELFKMLKKKLKRKEYKRIMERINRWKIKGKW
jgi:GH24 family phage-related lysozyme (muramidase)